MQYHCTAKRPFCSLPMAAAAKQPGTFCHTSPDVTATLQGRYMEAAAQQRAGQRTEQPQEACGFPKRLAILLHCCSHTDSLDSTPPGGAEVPAPLLCTTEQTRGCAHTGKRQQTPKINTHTRVLPACLTCAGLTFQIQLVRIFSKVFLTLPLALSRALQSKISSQTALLPAPPQQLSEMQLWQRRQSGQDLFSLSLWSIFIASTLKAVWWQAVTFPGAALQSTPTTHYLHLFISTHSSSNFDQHRFILSTVGMHHTET